MASIPRAVTCPTFASAGGSSPRGLPSWRRSGAVPTPPAAVITSRTILAATLLLYTLVLLGLPLLYSSFAAGGRQKGVADMQGTLEPQLARALRSRRMALEAGQAAAAHLWPEAASHFGTAAAQLPRVEFRDAGGYRRKLRLMKGLRAGCGALNCARLLAWLLQATWWLWWTP